MVEYKIIIIAVLIGIIPAIGISWWLLKSNGKKRGLGSKLLLATFLWGVLTAIPASIFQIINMENGGGNYFVLLFRKQ